MIDIEKMYFQICFTEQHRNLLQFLWWKKENISDKPTDYEMYVHVLGGVSSAACSTYVLKMTVIENKTKFGEEAAQTLQNNFYMDDLLKSVANEHMAVQLIKKVTGMCHERGFTRQNLQAIAKGSWNHSQRKTNDQVFRTKIL